MSIDINENFGINIQIPELRNFFIKLRDKLPHDGDLKHLDLDSLSERDVKIWEQYKRFLKLIKQAVDEKSEDRIADTISLVLSEFEKETSSFVEAFIKNRVTVIKGFFDLKKQIPSYDIWSSLTNEVQKQYHMIEV